MLLNILINSWHKHIVLFQFAFCTIYNVYYFSVKTVMVLCRWNYNTYCVMFAIFSMLFTVIPFIMVTVNYLVLIKDLYKKNWHSHILTFQSLSSEEACSVVIPRRQLHTEPHVIHFFPRRITTVARTVELNKLLPTKVYDRDRDINVN